MVVNLADNSEDKVRVHVSWCMTGAPIKQLLLDRRTTVSELKQMLEVSAKTPSSYLELLCDGGVLQDASCVSHAFASSCFVDLLAFRKQPPKFFDFLKSARQQSFRMWPPCTEPVSLSADRCEVRLAKYILAADGSGSLVNEQDVAWRDEMYETYAECTALHYAAAWGKPRICKLLLDHSRFRMADAHAEVGVPYSYQDVDYCGRSCTALHAAVAWDCREVVTLLLGHRRFSAVGACNAYGQTVLHMAVLAGCPEVVEEILADGRVECSARMRNGMTALDLAIQIYRSVLWTKRSRYLKIIEAFLLHDVNRRENFLHVLKEAAATLDSRLMRIAMGCHRGFGQLLAGGLVGKGWLNVELLLADGESDKETRRRDRYRQKDKKAQRKQHAAVKLASDAKHKARRNGRAKMSLRRSELDFFLCV